MTTAGLGIFVKFGGKIKFGFKRGAIKSFITIAD
jgi:hypothetical protein